MNRLATRSAVVSLLSETVPRTWTQTWDENDNPHVATDPKDPRTIFANSQSGRTYLVDLDTGEEQGLRPVPADANIN